MADMPRGDAAGFLDTIPTRYAVLALDNMGQWTSAAIMSLMDPASATAALREMEQISAAATLRLLMKEKRAELLDMMPAAKRRELNAVLAFPDDAVGAHMQTAIITVPENATLDAAIAAFKGEPEIEVNLIYIVDSSRKLRGVVKANMLLAASGQARVIDVADPDIEPISSRSRAEAVASLAQWDEYSELPVLNRRRQLIGAITRKDLRKAIDLSGNETYKASNSIIGGMAEAFITSALGLGAMLTEAGTTREGTTK